jgi:hypothetical protein
MSHRAKAAVNTLQRLLKDDVSVFYTDEVCTKLEHLLDCIKLEQDRRASERVIRDLWRALPENQHLIAWSRQRVTFMVQQLEAEGLRREDALRRVAEWAGYTCKAFRSERPWLLKDDWQALRLLGLGVNFMSLRHMRLWLEAQELEIQSGPLQIWEPLHLVDKEALQALPEQVRHVR